MPNWQGTCQKNRILPKWEILEMRIIARRALKEFWESSRQ